MADWRDDTMGVFYFKVMVYEKFGEEPKYYDDHEGSISQARAYAIKLLKKYAPKKRAYVMVYELPKPDKTSRKYGPLKYKGDVEKRTFSDGTKYIWITERGVHSKVPYIDVLDKDGRATSRRKF